MSDEFTVIGFGQHVLKEMVIYHLGEWIFGAAAAASVLAYHAYNTARIFHSGKFHGPSAVIQTTSYDPAYVTNPDGTLEVLINPQTGKIFRDQKIRTEELPITLGDLFPKDVSGRFVSYFNKAAKLADTDAPILYTHVPQVLPKKDREKIHELIRNSVQNYISGLYRKTDHMLAAKLGENQFFETNTILPVLIKEEGAMGWQLRILLLKLNGEGSIDIPERQNVRFLMSDGSYAPGNGSVEIDRYETMLAIKRTLGNPEMKSLLLKYAVEIPTGNILTVKLPVMAISSVMPM